MARLLSFIRYHADISVSVFLLFISLLLIALPSSLKLNYVKQLNRFFLSPAQLTVSYLTSIQDMKEEIASLRSTNIRLTLDLSRSENLVMENLRLKHLLEFTQEKGVEFLPSQVISISLDEPLTTVLLDKGAKDSVTVYAPVMTTEGLVGKIIEVDTSTNLAELFTHPQFRAAAAVPEKGEMGILRSTGSKLLLTGLSVTSEVSEGDRVVTSGLGGVYPEGIPIGWVDSVFEDEIGIEKVAEVLPCVSLTKLFGVAILVDESYVDSDPTMLRRAKGSLMWMWKTGQNVGDR